MYATELIMHIGNKIKMGQYHSKLSTVCHQVIYFCPTEIEFHHLIQPLIYLKIKTLKMSNPTSKSSYGSEPLIMRPLLFY